MKSADKLAPSLTDFRANKRDYLSVTRTPSHIKQTIGLLIGVATGIVIGELRLLLPESMPLLRLGLVAFVAMLAAASYGLPVVMIQAGVSAILIVTFGTATTRRG